MDHQNSFKLQHSSVDTHLIVLMMGLDRYANQRLTLLYKKNSF
ncbi:hypothetical protein SynBIOSE41_01735 [Synechococcus sp. BIOS-E4-1]|nr:hypothetical protein SynBIOSE41_01735 [Synechococcus sp. BIOS-E4-1]